ncbi:hypothetical protein DFP72DRAFT_1076900 [Ephemerocybe angulata]|uniref:F-box domain-containing protein n=1 Tax=Ephemerocybe angulata TaxID=980116 RepID=A0A8H6HF71_9AGAR|nr:hypothetical protein DFP72DRAFT_1076900 [Tulosesus angulatus]
MSLLAPRHISNVPQEIWLEMFQYFAPSPRQAPLPTDVRSPVVREGVAWTSTSPGTLYNLSQVCALFNKLAMRVARRLLVVGPSHDLDFWVQALAKDGSGDVVKRVEVHNLRSGLLQSLIRGLPNVTDLYVRHTNAAITNIPRRIGTHPLGFQSLTDVTLSGLSAFATIQILFNLSTVAWSLKRLWLVYALRGDPTPTSGAARCTFPSLEWLIVGAPGRRFQPQRAGEAMKTILLVFADRFDFPEITRFDNLDVLGYQAPFFARFGRQLEVIAITSEDYDLAPNANFSGHCPALKTIIISLVHRDFIIANLDLHQSVKRVILRVHEFLPWQGEEEGQALLRRALYQVSRRWLSFLETIVISGITDWGHSAGWFCRRSRLVQDEGIQVVEIV